MIYNNDIHMNQILLTNFELHHIFPNNLKTNLFFWYKITFISPLLKLVSGISLCTLVTYTREQGLVVIIDGLHIRHFITELIGRHSQ